MKYATKSAILKGIGAGIVFGWFFIMVVSVGVYC